MKISFIIPTIKQFELLFDTCIKSLIHHHKNYDYELIVVEDGSEKTLQAKVVKECKKRKITCLVNEVNLGFSRTVNRGLKAATGDICVLVNNDIEFIQDVISPLITHFKKDEKIGVIGALLFYPNGTIQHGGMQVISPGIFTHYGWHKQVSQAPEVLETRYLLAVTGALFAIRKECLKKVGYLNEEYFVSCEDSEYCLRTWENGYKVLYTPEVKAIHIEGKTRGNTPEVKQKDHPEWMEKENESAKRFAKDVSSKYSFIWNALLKKVKNANLEISNETSSCGVRRYGEAISFPVCGPRATSRLIAVKRSGALGDVILTTGIIRRLKEVNPHHDILVITKMRDVFKNNPFAVGSIIDHEACAYEYDKLIDLDDAYERLPKTHILWAYTQQAELNERGQFLPELYSTEEDAISMRSKMGGIRLGIDKVALIHPAVSWASRTLSQFLWNEVAKGLIQKGYMCAIVGSHGDHKLQPQGGSIHQLHGRLSIHEVRELMKYAQVFIGPDSGLMHVAQTTNIPIVSIFTVANPEYRIVARQAKTLALIPKVQCRFCLHEQPAPVRFTACQYGTNACLNDFDSPSILKAIWDATGV